MRIGELARRANVSVQAVRFYERRRMLKKPARTPSGYRVYTENDLEMVQTIRKAQHFGFTLKEIRLMLQLFALPDERTGKTPYAHGEPACLVEIARMCERKLAEFDEQIRSLTAVRRELADTLGQVLASTNRQSRKPPARQG